MMISETMSNEQQLLSTCSKSRTNEEYCSLSPTCKGWGCKLLMTAIDEIPKTDQEKAKLFVRVYREAKQKGVLKCPHYRPLFIDEVLDNIGITTPLSDFYQTIKI